MQTLRISFLLILLASATLTVNAQSASISQEIQIKAAVSAAPEALREHATVYGYTGEGRLTILRQGEGELICLADNPTDERFHVACYHRSLESFMARGRALKAEGRERDEIQRIREEETASGALRMPASPAALYSLSGAAETFDPETGEISGAAPLYVVYLPYATAESTGLPTSAPPGQPWIMEPGKPWAHIMIIPPRN